MQILSYLTTIHSFLTGVSWRWLRDSSGAVTEDVMETVVYIHSHTREWLIIAVNSIPARVSWIMTSKSRNSKVYFFFFRAAEHDGRVVLPGNTIWWQSVSFQMWRWTTGVVSIQTNERVRSIQLRIEKILCNGWARGRATQKVVGSSVRRVAGTRAPQPTTNQDVGLVG